MERNKEDRYVQDRLPGFDDDGNWVGIQRIDPQPPKRGLDIDSPEPFNHE
ncbi:MAG: hypothetical protein KJ993_17155 [Actinobacteria bacterium]|nr:hypothetical protein [Actinomycetota bacterium]